MLRGWKLKFVTVPLMGVSLVTMALAMAQPPGGGQPPIDKEVETWVKQLVERMTDPREQIRGSAYEALKSLGAPAVPTLQKMADGETPTAVAARRALNTIQPAQGKGPGGKGGGKGGGGKGKGKGQEGVIKPSMADTIKANIYADNWFILYINGKLTVVDSIDFIPHNVISVDILPEYPMTIAILAKDNADPKTGMEYGNHIGDGGFILRFGDGTVTNAKWKAKCFFKGPLNRDMENPKVWREPIPKNWWAVDFDDSSWPNATEYTEERVGPKEHFYKYDFTGAKWIWSDDLDLDNTVIFRYKVEKPGWKPRWNTKPNFDITGALPWEKDM